MNVTFLRHCESLFNIDESSEERDVKLSDRGEFQAKTLVGEYDLIICSPLKRTRQTLNLSHLKSQHIIYTNLCREIRIDMCDFMLDEPLKLETDEDVKKRITQFKKFLYIHKNINRCLIISHHDFIYELTGTKLECSEMINCDIDLIN